MQGKPDYSGLCNVGECMAADLRRAGDYAFAGGMSQLVDAVRNQGARLTTYEAALAPFVALAEAYKEHSGAWLDEHTVYSFNGVGITLGDLKRACKALEAK